VERCTPRCCYTGGSSVTFWVASQGSYESASGSWLASSWGLAAWQTTPIAGRGPRRPLVGSAGGSHWGRGQPRGLQWSASPCETGTWVRLSPWTRGETPSPSGPPETQGGRDSLSESGSDLYRDAARGGPLRVGRVGGTPLRSWIFPPGRRIPSRSAPSQAILLPSRGLLCPLGRTRWPL
jgi:hypothetical protein